MKQLFAHRSGSALIIVLGMLSVLLLMGVAFSVTMRTERSGASNMRHTAMARHILDSALARAMGDLDRALEEDGDIPTPTNLVVDVSYSKDGATGVNPLSYEASLHLPGDQRIAALFEKAHWLPIYGDVRISKTDKNDPADDDSPVGRYAYIVLNGCGFLDPNVVGDSHSNRLFGLSPHEIDVSGSDGKILGQKHAKQASDFISKRESSWGHFASMRDFLRPEVTNYLGFVSTSIQGTKCTFPTNSFFVGSLALDDLAPPSGQDSDGFPVRNPKFALREYDSNGDLVMIDPKELIEDKDWCRDFVEAMTNSFRATYKGQANNQSGNIPAWFRDAFNQSKAFRYSLLAARNLLEMMDEDGCPGGTRKHRWNDIGKQDDSNKDEYLAAFGSVSWNWDRLPCVEPVPMLDNLIICGGYDPDLSTSPDGKETRCLTWVLEREKIPDPVDASRTVDGNVTGIVCTVTLTLCGSSDIYTGWNVPEDAVGDYTYKWRFTGVEADSPADGYPRSFQPFQDAMDNLSFTAGEREATISLARDKDGRPEANRAPADFFRLPPVKFCIKVEPSVPSVGDDDLSKYVPDDFGLVLHAVGVMGRGNKSAYQNDIVQVVPCQEHPIAQASGESVLDVYLPINREEALKKKTAEYVLGATYALDPRFAYEKKSWIWTPGIMENTSGLDDEPDYKLRKSLVRETLDALGEDVLAGDHNPLTLKYLRDPRQEIGGRSLFAILAENHEAIVGGVSDVMRSSPKAGTYPTSNSATASSALSVFFDPAESDDSPWAFTRVGQLGFVPIGTHRTISLMDGFDNANDNAHVEVRQRVLDYFTMHPPRLYGDEKTNSLHLVKSALFASRVNINPPRIPEISKNGEVTMRGWNILPLTAAFNECPLREWDDTAFKVDWKTAEDLVAVYTNTLARNDSGVHNTENRSDWKSDFNDADGVTRSLSVLGRSSYDSNVSDRETFDTVLHNKFSNSCDFDREGVIRNTSEMLTTRQQLFTILLKADSFTPRAGFNDADHGTSLASVQAIAHIWRDPEPLRNANGQVVTDNGGNPIHAWVLLDMFQF